MKYTDPFRVDLLFNFGDHGVTRVHRFPLVGAPVADGLRLTNVQPLPLQVFAVTLERPIR